MKIPIEWLDMTKLKLNWDVNSEKFYLEEESGDVVSTGATVTACIDKLYAEQVYEKLRNLEEEKEALIFED